jgi:dUTPase
VILTVFPQATPPTRRFEGSGLMQLYMQEDYAVGPLEEAVIDLGLLMSIPEGFIAQIHFKTGRSATPPKRSFPKLTVEHEIYGG